MARRIKQGLWYQCRHSHGAFTKGNYYFAPTDGHLNADNNKPTPADYPDFFGPGNIIKIATPK